MPNGPPDFDNVPATLGAIWSELRSINGRLDRLPCERREAEIEIMKNTLARASGERGLIVKMLPYILAALGIGAASGVIGQKATTPAPAPRPASNASP